MHESFNEKYEYIYEKYIWKNELKDEYINRLSQESTKSTVRTIRFKTFTLFKRNRGSHHENTPI